MLNRPARQRLHLRTVEELPSDFDDEIADLFREMREATGLPSDQLAAQLGTPPATLTALERGDIRGLPAWPETNRVVIAYAELLSLDPDPVLRRIMLQLPPDHPRRPRTEQAAPSFANLRSNIDAAMARVPDGETPVERLTLPASSAPAAVAPVRPARPQPAVAAARPQPPVAPPPVAPLAAAVPAESGPPQPGYGDLRAYPNDARWAGYPPPPPAAAQPQRRRNGFGVGLLQLLLLLILLASGYAMWLAMNDPQAFAALKVQLEDGLRQLVERGRGLADGAPPAPQ